jgi:rhodanese-related sulfurtransferase
MRIGVVTFGLVLLASSVALAHTDLTPAQVKAWVDTTKGGVLVDVREESEFCDSTYSPPGHIPGAINMPWNSGYFQAHYTELPMYDDIIIVCRSGNRSNSAANFLDAADFSRVFDMTGGMNEWIWETDLCASAGVPGRADGADPGDTSSGLMLGPASPNPFTSRTEISFVIPPGSSARDVTFGVYDGRGRLISETVLRGQRPGESRFAWDGRDAAGNTVASGLYFYRLTWSGQSLTRRVVLLR